MRASSLTRALLPLRCRVAEQLRVDVTPLIVDRTASSLLDVVAAGSAASEPPPPRELVDLVAVRTRAVDAWLDQPTWPPVRTTRRQIVLLGAGLDARAYRMGLGQRATIYEVELDTALVKQKRAVLSSFQQRTAVVDVVADVRHPAQTAEALLAAGLDTTLPTKWVYEGPLISSYDDEPAAGSLFEMAARCGSSPGSTVAAALFEPEWARQAAALGGEVSSDAACLAPIEVTLEQARRTGWREKRTVRRADFAAKYGRDLHDSFALMFAEADPDP